MLYDLTGSGKSNVAAYKLEILVLEAAILANSLPIMSTSPAVIFDR